MTGLALYDMDRTITRRGTYTPWLLYWAWHRAPWRLALLPLSGVFGLLYVAKAITRGRLKELNHRLLMGDRVARAEVMHVADRFAARVVARGLLPGAVRQVAADRAEGRRIVIATASYAFYAEAIGRALGIADVIGTRSVWDGDRLRARIDGDNCYGPAKLAMVEAWLAAHGLTGTAIRFYSDHVSDAPVFERADEQVATTPSPKLRALAGRRGWRVVDWT